MKTSRCSAARLCRAKLYFHWTLNQLIPRRLQTWMLSWIPLSGQASPVSHQVKDRPSFTSNTSPDYNRLPRTAEALIQGFVTSRHRILPEAPICPESLSFLICSTPWLYPHPHHPCQPCSFPSVLIPELSLGLISLILP